ncbi:MAG: response regulator [Desulfobacterales bacterium]|nr:response regulator [Desulfobacterales bacterium]
MPASAPIIDIAPPHILVVDDEKDIIELLSTAIERAGMTCSTATSARDALDIISRIPVDVVVTDIHMPEMSGIELGRRIKACSNANVIVMTGHVKDFTYEEIVAKGASDFLKKPVRLKEFIARLKRVLGERGTLASRNRALTDLKHNLEKYRLAMDGFVQAMSRAVEIRDPYTAGHQRRVAKLAAAIAEKIGLSPDRIHGLRLAGAIHDIGKIGVPAEILCKPGKLNELEYGIIQLHPKVGYNILKDIAFPWPVAEIVLQHHERLDGSGYPQGLRGEAILKETRILSVADVFETIATHRPYRPARGLDKAMEELETNSGILYDPEAVSACQELFSDNRFSLD